MPPHGRPLYGGDDRCLDVEQSHRVSVQASCRGYPVIGEVVAEVGARAEVFALRCEHDGAAVGFVIECPRRVEVHPMSMSSK